PEHLSHDSTFQIIHHPFTKPPNPLIQKNYPKSKLQLHQEKTPYKSATYPIRKYIYQKHDQQQLTHTLQSYIHHYFPSPKIQYFT
uniref:spore photoproduct lyase family protein n=1 Tax=Bacillus pumilus TaxID=1408 RepID=UPI0037044AAB